MELETLEKAVWLKGKIDREKSILEKIRKLSQLNKTKQLTSEDIDYILRIAFDGSNYIKNDLENKFREL